MPSRITGISGFPSIQNRISPAELIAASTEDKKVQEEIADSDDLKLRRALAGNPNITENVAEILASDDNIRVLRILARNPNISVAVQLSILERGR